MAALRKMENPKALAKFRQSITSGLKSDKTRIRLCMAVCRSGDSKPVKEAFRREILAKNLDEKVELIETGCHGLCARGPVAIIDPDDIFYQNLTPERVPEIVSKTIISGKIVEDLTYFDSKSRKRIHHSNDIPFFRDQVKVILRNFGKIDPRSINDYLANDGYDALAKALSMRPEEVLEEITRSGLRGRGGAGFPTGLKWKFTREAKGEPKYIICNAEEGEPGTFKDKIILESDPHSIIEGMIISAYAIGASIGYIYLQNEYKLAVSYLENAVKQAEDMGLLGKNILGSGFDFELRIHRAPGSFVCGEETALMNTIEGERGYPRLRPPHPPQAGLWGKPTAINNVETLANVPPIVSRGSDWYNSLGTEKSKGTKVHSLSGILRNTGLIELPMGHPLSEFIFDYGGGIESGYQLKAIHVGGPSGACLSPIHLNLPVDYDALCSVGAFMGAGAIVPLSDRICLVDYVKSLMYFFTDESCSKCVPCRLGSRRIFEILVKITSGKGEMGDLDLLEELAMGMKEGSFCGLGQMAPIPILFLLKHFREEFKKHIEDKSCPACVCDDMVVAPCSHACPAHVDIPAFNGLVAQGKFEEALSVYKERNPLLGVCGYICPHPCQNRCTRDEIEEPLAIANLERFISDTVKDQRVPPPHPSRRTDKKIAIMGSGPTGLTTAYHLALSGHKVTVFEGGSRAGGLLNAVPTFKLPKKVLERDIRSIEEIGVKIEVNAQLGDNFNIDELFGKGFSAILISIGSGRKKYKIIDPSSLEAAEDGLRFLIETNLGKRKKVPRRVAVIGPVALAADVARTALRLGAKEVHLVSKEARDEIYEIPDLYDAEREGIKLHLLASPVSITTGEEEMISLLKVVHLEQGDYYEGGKRTLSPIARSEFELKVDSVFSLFKKPPDLSFLSESGITFDEMDAIVTDAETGMTNREGVFSVGAEADASVIEAIAAGQKAAFNIERYLFGFSAREREIDLREQRTIEHQPDLEESIRVELMPQHSVDEKSPRSRIRDFDVYKSTLAKDQGVREARRCLRCDLESIAGKKRMSGLKPV